jgi:hypothetical protein
MKANWLKSLCQVQNFNREFTSCDQVHLFTTSVGFGSCSVIESRGPHHIDPVL